MKKNNLVIPVHPKTVLKGIETIEFSDNGELQGWCQLLRDLGLKKCPGKKCETCYCG